MQQEPETDQHPAPAPSPDPAVDRPPPQDDRRPKPQGPPEDERRRGEHGPAEDDTPEEPNPEAWGGGRLEKQQCPIP